MSEDAERDMRKVRRLGDALKRVRTAEAERSDVVVELRDAERARLEMLADELQTVFDEIPADDEQFILTVAPGTPARLWIDMTSFVVMGRDRRTYRFLKDTRLGRTILLETAELAGMADTITNYVAERIVERERALEGDWLVKRLQRDASEARERANDDGDETPRRHGPSAVTGWIVAAFLAGTLAGAAVLFGSAWFAIGG